LKQANCLDEAEGRRKPEELVVVSTTTKDESAAAASEKASAFSLISASWNKLPVPVPKGKNIAFAAPSAVAKWETYSSFIVNRFLEMVTHHLKTDR